MGGRDVLLRNIKQPERNYAGACIRISGNFLRSCCLVCFIDNGDCVAFCKSRLARVSVATAIGAIIATEGWSNKGSALSDRVE